ncbi:MAG: hypothetical protein QXI02_04070 [Candidatus Caldarchaeum sp.]
MAQKFYFYNPKTKSFRVSDTEEEDENWYLIPGVSCDEDLKELDEKELRFWLWMAKVRRGEEESVIDISLRHSRLRDRKQ